MDLQEIRNALCEVEDAARAARNSQNDLTDLDHDMRLVFGLLAKLTQIIREEIVK